MSQSGQEIYDFKNVENNWKSKWFDNNLYKAVDFDPKPKKYILAELPYPSGDFLHIGHMMRYTVPEIYSRYLRMNGFNVLFPMGWDCFGLPAEVFAITQKTTPQKLLKEVIPKFKESMKSMGYGIDWEREIDTTDPEYYKWTQWMFLKLYDMGLVKKKAMPAWWCEELGNLADEEVVKDENGNTVSERKGYPVKRVQMDQWVLDLPKYADKLLEDLKYTNYTDSVKEAQSNWIGRKEGVNITYNVVDTDEKVTVFTTRPETNFGATFIVLAPEHRLIDIAVNKAKAGKDFDTANKLTEYVERSKNKGELERISDKRNKTGVFTGLYAFNELNGRRLPIWVSDFVLGHVGTAAVVGVPGHDIRDFEFAKAMNIEIIRVIGDKDNIASEIKDIADVQSEEGTMVNSDFLTGMEINEANMKIIDFLVKKGWGERVVSYNVREQIFSRKRYWGEPIPLMYRADGGIEKVSVNELPIKLPDLDRDLTQDNVSKVLDENIKWKTTKDSNGNVATREIETMPTWAGSNWYYIRYLDPKNDKEYASADKIKYWLPVDKYFGDPGHTAAHLLYTRFWLKALYDGGFFPLNEPIDFRMSGGLLLGPDNHKMSKSRGNVVIAEDVLKKYGADSTRLYLASIGPYSDTYPWKDGGVRGCFRLLSTFYSLKKNVISDKESDSESNLYKTYYRVVNNMTRMIEEFKLNTAVSQIYILVNELKKATEIPGDIWVGTIKLFAPFAPFLAEELWQDYNKFEHWDNKNSIHLQSWPKLGSKPSFAQKYNIAIQVNGKIRGVLESIDDNNSEEMIKELCYKKLEGKLNKEKVVKIVYIQNKLISFVVKD